jgi:hypothetical protein
MCVSYIYVYISRKKFRSRKKKVEEEVFYLTAVSNTELILRREFK